MAQSAVAKHLYDGSIKFLDGTGTPLEFTTAFTMGDFSVDGLAESQRDVVAYQSRGVLRSVRYAALNFPTFSLSAMVRQFTENADGTLLDVVRKTGTKWAAGVSTDGASAECWLVKVVITLEGTDHGDASDHTFAFDDCHCTIGFAEGEPDVFNVSGTIYGTIVAA